MAGKKLEDCHLIIRLWRYRWYMLLPFRWIWYKIFGISDCYSEITVRTDVKNKNLMNILISEIQIKILDYKSTLNK
jgi:hypothetical protein